MSAKKIVLLVVGLLACGVIVAGIALVVLVPRWVEARVIAEANARGVQLQPGKVSFGLGWLQVSDAQLKLIGAPSVSMRVGLIDTELAGMQPKQFRMSRVHVEVLGDPATAARELDAWSRAHRRQLTEPVSVKDLSLTIKRAPDAQPQLELTAAELRLQGERASLVAKSVRAVGRELGEVKLDADQTALRIGLTFAHSTLENPLLTVDVSGTSERTVHVALSPIAVEQLSTIVGVKLPNEKVSVSGTFDATVPNNLAAGGRVVGRVDALLRGYIPPHPVELDGFVFGDTTAISTRFALEPSNLRVLLEETRVKAGAFELSGNGELRAEGMEGHLALLLQGYIPCNALASATAETRLGRALGGVTGKAARQVVSGAVGVRVSIEASTRAPDRPLVLKTITAGCGLKPLSLQELVKLGELVPEALTPEVARDFEKLLQKNLPVLAPPAGGISLSIPGLTLPGIGLPEAPRRGAPSSSARNIAPAPPASAAPAESR